MAIPQPTPMRPRPANRVGKSQRSFAQAAGFLAAMALFPAASQALTGDRDKEMNIDAQYSRIEQGDTGGGPNVTYLKGNVQISQGSLKATSDEATIEQAASQANNAGGQIKRVLMTGQPAHLEQRQDGGGMMRASALKIDYQVASNTVELSGNVIVNQEGRGEFHGAHMTYNTLTGTMESGAEPGGRVHMRILPHGKPAATDANGTSASRSPVPSSDQP